MQDQKLILIVDRNAGKIFIVYSPLTYRKGSDIIPDVKMPPLYFCCQSALATTA